MSRASYPFLLTMIVVLLGGCEQSSPVKQPGLVPADVELARVDFEGAAWSNDTIAVALSTDAVRILIPEGGILRESWSLPMPYKPVFGEFGTFFIRPLYQRLKEIGASHRLSLLIDRDVPYVYVTSVVYTAAQIEDFSFGFVSTQAGRLSSFPLYVPFGSSSCEGVAERTKCGKYALSLLAGKDGMVWSKKPGQSCSFVQSSVESTEVSISSLNGLPSSESMQGNWSPCKKALAIAADDAVLWGPIAEAWSELQHRYGVRVMLKRL